MKNNKNKVFKSFSDFSMDFVSKDKSSRIKAAKKKPKKTHVKDDDFSATKVMIHDKKHFVRKPQARKQKIRFDHELFNSLKLSGLKNLKNGNYKEALSNFSDGINNVFEFIKNSRDEGVVKKEKGDVEGAIKEYREGKKVFKKLNGFLYHRGIIRKKMKDYAGAMEDFTILLKYHPNHKKAYINRIDISKRLGDFDDVINDLDVLCQLETSNPVYLYQKGKALILKGLKSEAIDAYKKALSIDKKGSLHFLKEGKELIKRNRLKPALKKINSGILKIEKIFNDFSKKNEFDLDCTSLSEKLGLPSFDLYFQSANVHEKLGQYEEALKDYQNSLKYKDDPVVQFYLADILMILKRYDDSLIVFSKILEKDNENYAAFVKRGQIFLENGNFTEAIKDFSDALKIEPYHVPLYLKRAEAKMSISDYRGAYEDFSRILEFKPKESELHFKRAIASLMLGEIATAMEDLRLFVKNDNSSIANIYKAARRQYKAHDYEGVKSLISQCIDKTKILFTDIRHRSSALDKMELKNKIESDEELSRMLNIPLEKYYYLRGITNKHLKNYKAAINDLDLSIEIGELDNEKAFIEKCKILIKNRDYKTAFKDIKGFIEKNPKHDFAYFIRAEVYYHRNDFESAKKDLNKAIKINPGYAHYHAALGRNFFKMKLYQSAFLSFKKALEKDKKDCTALKGLSILHTVEGSGKEVNLIEALKYGTRALHVCKDDESYQILAMIYSFMREFDNAVKNQEIACELSNNKNNKILLERYRQKKVWTDLSI